MKAVEELRRRVKAEKIKDMEGARTCLRRVLTDMLQVGEPALKLDTTPSVALFIGVNGVGKTTTIGKLSARMTGEGHRVLMAAADTFRAAAADQLEIWSAAQRRGARPPVRGRPIPAAVVFDALTAAKARQRRRGAHRHRRAAAQQAEPDERAEQDQPRSWTGSCPMRRGDPAGAGRHHRTERPDPGQAVQGGRGHHRHCPDQAGRHRPRAALSLPSPRSFRCR